VKKIKYYILDVFTNQRFGGNQLAVIPDATEIDDKLMQKIAFEFNFSETTFVLPPGNSANDVKVRIFTPHHEIPTAGHPTIGTAYSLLNLERIITLNEDKLVMEQRVGDIEVYFKEHDGFFDNITMKQPLPAFGEIFENKAIISEILGISVEDIDNGLPIQAVSCGNNFLYIPVNNQDAIKQIMVNTSLLEKHKEMLPSTEIYVFTFDTTYEDSTIHARMFAPLFGIYEDPVTGSASGPLGCYLVKYGKSDGNGIICEQGFEMNRAGIVNVNIETLGNEITGVFVGGEAVLISKGELYPEAHHTKKFLTAVLNKI